MFIIPQHVYYFILYLFLFIPELWNDIRNYGPVIRVYKKFLTHKIKPRAKLVTYSNHFILGAPRKYFVFFIYCVYTMFQIVYLENTIN